MKEPTLFYIPPPAVGVIFPNGGEGKMPMPIPHTRGKSYRKRSILFNQQHGICPYCDRPLDGPEYGTFDHIVPKSKGGKKNLKNLCLVHPECNATKGSFATYDEAMAWALKFSAFFEHLKKKGIIQ